MIKKYIGDLAVVQLLNLLVKPLWIFAIDSTVQNKLPKEEYGAYFTFLSFTFLFTVFLDFGLTSFNTISLSENKERLQNRFHRLLSLKVLLAAVYLCVVLLFGGLLGYFSLSFKLLLTVTLIQICSSFNLFFRGSLAAFELFKLDGLFMVIDRILMIFLCSWMIWGNGFLNLTIYNFAFLQLGVLIFVSISLIFTLYQKMDAFKLTFDFTGIKRILSKSWPFGLLFALMSLYHYLDSVMLEKLSENGVADVAIYAQGYRIFYALLLFSHVFSNMMLPLFSKHKKDLPKLLHFVQFNTRLLLWVAISVSVVGWAYRLEIMTLLYPHKSPELAALPFGLIILGYIGTMMMVLFGTFLTSLRKLKWLNWYVFATVLVNILLNSLLIPRYGVSGAAFATLVSQFILGVASWVGTKKILFEWSLFPILKSVGGYLILLSLVAIGLKTLIGNFWWHSVLVIIAIGIGFWWIQKRKYTIKKLRVV